MNQVFLKGNVGKDAEVKTTKNGVAYVNFSLATSRKVGNGYETDWHNVTVWKDAARPLHKGDIVMVVGQYIQRSWTDRNGNNVTGHQVSSFEMFRKPKSEGPQQPQQGPAQAQMGPNF